MLLSNWTLSKNWLSQHLHTDKVVVYERHSEFHINIMNQELYKYELVEFISQFTKNIIFQVIWKNSSLSRSSPIRQFFNIQDEIESILINVRYRISYYQRRTNERCRGSDHFSASLPRPGNVWVYSVRKRFNYPEK